MAMRLQIKAILAIFFSLICTYAGVSHAQYPGFGDPGANVGTVNGSGGLIPVEATTDGGKIPIGATAQVVVLFRNEGGQPVEIGTIRLYPSSTVSADISLNQCKDGALPSGAECAIALSIKGLQAGPWRLEMLMAHSGRTRLVTATVSGSVETSEGLGDKRASDIETIPDFLDYGSLKSAQTLIEPVILRNITSNPIDITDIYINSSEQAGYSMDTECKTLSAGQACIATVTWSPKTRGRSSGVLVVKHTGPAGLSSVPLKGEYIPDNVGSAEVFPQAVPGKGLLVSSSEEINFGIGIETASTSTISLVNAGDAAMRISNIFASGSDNGISFTEEGCTAGTVLDPIEACALTVKWSPTRVGEVFDDIQIIHNGARGVLVLPVRGNAANTVSPDQKSIILTNDNAFSNIPPLPASALDEDFTDEQAAAAERNRKKLAAPVNPASVTGLLDGYKITSFSPTRAIINGPGGSRLVYDNEDVVIGGVPWLVMIQPKGIEFMHEGQRVLMLFDRSLTSFTRYKTGTASRPTTSTSSASGTSTDNTISEIAAPTISTDSEF